LHALRIQAARLAMHERAPGGDPRAVTHTRDGAGAGSGQPGARRREGGRRRGGGSADGSEERRGVHRCFWVLEAEVRSAS